MCSQKHDKRSGKFGYKNQNFAISYFIEPIGEFINSLNCRFHETYAGALDEMKKRKLRGLLRPQSLLKTALYH